MCWRTSSLRSVILDSVVPMDFDEDSMKDQAASSAMRAFFAACAADPACGRDFPDLEIKVMAKADELNANPLEITVTLPDGSKVKDQFHGNDLTRMIFDTLYSTELTKMLPAHLDAVVNQGDYSWAGGFQIGGVDPRRDGRRDASEHEMPALRQLPGQVAGAF